MANINLRDIPDDLVKQFKIHCLEKDISMRKEIIRLMKEVVEKVKKGKL